MKKILITIFTILLLITCLNCYIFADEEEELIVDRIEENIIENINEDLSEDNIENNYDNINNQLNDINNNLININNNLLMTSPMLGFQSFMRSTYYVPTNVINDILYLESTYDLDYISGDTSWNIYGYKNEDLTGNYDNINNNSNNFYIYFNKEYRKSGIRTGNFSIRLIDQITYTGAIYKYNLITDNASIIYNTNLYHLDIENNIEHGTLNNELSNYQKDHMYFIEGEDITYYVDDYDENNVYYWFLNDELIHEGTSCTFSLSEDSTLEIREEKAYLQTIIFDNDVMQILLNNEEYTEPRYINNNILNNTIEVIMLDSNYSFLGIYADSEYKNLLSNNEIYEYINDDDKVIYIKSSNNSIDKIIFEIKVNNTNNTNNTNRVIDVIYIAILALLLFKNLIWGDDI